MADLIRILHRDDFDVGPALVAARAQGVAGYVHWALDRASELTILPDRVIHARRANPVGVRDRYLAQYFQTHPRAAWLCDLISMPERVSAISKVLWPSRSFSTTEADHEPVISSISARASANSYDQERIVSTTTAISFGPDVLRRGSPGKLLVSGCRGAE